MKLPGNAPVYLGEPGVSRVRDEEVMKAQVVGIVATDVAGLRFLIHRSQKRLEHGAFIVAQRDREFASDLVVECRAQVVELLRFVDCESPHERSAVARERDEALLTKRLQRFTQRRPRSRWSKINRDTAERLIAEGRMRPAGLAEVERAKADGRWDAAYEGQRSAAIPDDLQRELDLRPRAKEFFGQLSSQNRYAILYRLQDAKRPETRARRLAKFVAMLEEGETIYP